MKRESIILSLLIFASFFTAIQGCSVQRKTVQRPLLLNLEELDTERNVSNSELSKSLRLLGDSHSEDSLLMVIDKNSTFAPDNHYYCSMGPYWWPDPEKPGKYINRDGLVNPNSRKYDRQKLAALAIKSFNLSKAFYLTGDTAFYNTFIKQLQVWFVDKETYMYPNFEYAQVIPGERNNKGRSTGLIDAYDFNTVIESIRLVNSVKRIDKRTMEALQSWFSDFAEWADKGEFSEALHRANNNIGVAYDVTLVNMYLFSGKEEQAKEIVDNFAESRLNMQIMDDGRQPEELKRTLAFSYSILNLTHIVDMFFLARYWYPNYYHDHQERIDKAFAFLGQYVNKPEAFPYQQISSWDSCKKDYNTQVKRLNVLRGVIGDRESKDRL